MRTREFERWLRRVERGLPPTTSARDEAGAILRHWRGLPEKDRGDCLDRLLRELLNRRRAYGVAFFLLEGITDREHLRRFAEHLLPLPDLLGDDQEGHLADLVRVLGATDDARMLPPVEAYLLERPIATYWASVPWSLWPHRQNLFARAWERFFVECPAAGHHASVLVTFLAEPEAVNAVKARLVRSSENGWIAVRDALLALAAETEWLGVEEREALERATR